MRRSWRILALLAAFAIVVAACGDDDEPTATPAPTAAPTAAPTSPPDTMAPFVAKSVVNQAGCAADGSGSIINSWHAMSIQA